MGRVEGKVALVAGAGGGIGGAGALGLGREGAAVVCADIDIAAADAAAAQIRTAGGGDAALARGVREFGRLDACLDCVGVSQTAAFLDLYPAAWDSIIAVNLTGM